MQRAIRLFSDTFVPIIPVLVATGLFMGVRGMITQEAILSIFGMTPADVPENLLIYTRVLTDTAFVFLPALVCWSTMRNFGGSPIISTVLGLNEQLPWYIFVNLVAFATAFILTWLFGFNHKMEEQ